MDANVILKADFTLNVDFTELREQKKQQKKLLIDACDLVPDNVRQALEGILGLLDSIQDQAVDVYNLDEDKVFHLSDD
jgi:hypothetical protein